MVTALTETMGLSNLWTAAERGIFVGQIIRITEEGCALVDYPGNLKGPVKARSVIASLPQCNDPGERITPVLLAFEDGDPGLPIIIGVIRDTLSPVPPTDERTLPLDRPRNALIDGNAVVLEAQQEIVLRCGKSSVTLRKDGKIVVKGTHIVSRASGTNKVKGASVRIN